MWFRRFVMAALASAAASTCVNADMLSVSFHDPASPVVHDIQWNPASSSPVMVFGIENATSPPIDRLYGWQLGLEIVPGPGATGTLRFKTATVPDSYVLAGLTGGPTPLSAPAATIPVIGDADLVQFTGALVASSGKNFLKVDFDVLPGTSGLFFIRAVPDLINGSNWYSGDFTARDFENVPFGGGAVSLGSVNIVPEPSTVILLVIGLLGTGVLTFRRRVS
jgi:hypothetical protein